MNFLPAIVYGTALFGYLERNGISRVSYGVFAIMD
jgi:hypothetical protein